MCEPNVCADDNYTTVCVCVSTVCSATMSSCEFKSESNCENECV